MNNRVGSKDLQIEISDEGGQQIGQQRAWASLHYVHLYVLRWHKKVIKVDQIPRALASKGNLVKKVWQSQRSDKNDIDGL